MEKAFVLINCEPGQEPAVIEQLQKLEDVIDTQETYGVYDIVARIESDNQSQLDNIISGQIRKLNNINSTLTLIPTEHEEGLKKLIPDIMPDIIPEQKKPLEEQYSEHEEEDLDEEYDDEDYDDETKLN